MLASGSVIRNGLNPEEAPLIAATLRQRLIASAHNSRLILNLLKR